MGATTTTTTPTTTPQNQPDRRRNTNFKPGSCAIVNCLKRKYLNYLNSLTATTTRTIIVGLAQGFSLGPGSCWGSCWRAPTTTLRLTVLPVQGFSLSAGSCWGSCRRAVRCVGDSRAGRPPAWNLDGLVPTPAGGKHAPHAWKLRIPSVQQVTITKAQPVRIQSSRPRRRVVCVSHCACFNCARLPCCKEGAAATNCKLQTGRDIQNTPLLTPQRAALTGSE